MTDYLMRDEHPILTGGFDVPDPELIDARLAISRLVAAEVGGAITLKLILDKAEAAAQAALWQLVEIDPSNQDGPGGIRELQHEVKRCRDIGRWITAEVASARMQANEPKETDYGD